MIVLRNDGGEAKVDSVSFTSGEVSLTVAVPKRVANWSDLGNGDILDPRCYAGNTVPGNFSSVTFDFTDVEAFAPSTLFDMICKCDDRGIADISFINIPYRHTSYLMRLSAVFDIPVTVKVRAK